MPMIKAVCGECTKKFDKEKREYDRQLRRNSSRKFFCTRTCAARYRNKNLSVEERKKVAKRLAPYQKQAREASRVAIKTKWNTGSGRFSYYLRKARTRNKSVKITNEYLEKLWIQQNGLCALSGIPLSLNKERNGQRNLRLASLDRIDSTKGYNPGNVQFIAVPLNYAKNDYNDEEFQGFLIEVARGVLSMK